MGLSDPLLAGAVPPLEQRVADLLAVLDAVHSSSAALYGSSDGGHVALLFAAMHPDRVDAIILSGTWARFYRADDYPFGLDLVDARSDAARMGAQWGNIDEPWGFDAIAPSRRTEPGYRELLARVQQVSASPAAAVAIMLNRGDVRDVLPLVQAPTLVMRPAEATPDTAGHAQFLAEHIPNARLATLPGTDLYLGDNSFERTALIEEFLTGARPALVNDRVLATVMFTDIVASTERVAKIGDRNWSDQLDRHDALVRAQLDAYRGREISTAGDSFFAVFDGPARAIRCAQTIINDAKAHGIEVRAGVHTGECEIRGDDYAGIAVHIGARVAALADACTVLTTNTVKDLVAGSGITFTDRGTHTLKGVPGPMHLYQAT
jgi:class 3 adenylate cyclase